jgi:transposase
MGEPGRTKAYHEDLRWCIVWQRIARNKTIRDISTDLCIATSTVWRILDRFECTGCVTPNAATSRDHALHEHDELLLIEIVCEHPSVHLHEVQSKLHEVTGTEASIATICRSLKKNGFSRKKVQFVALQRSDRLRAEYHSDV